MRKWKEYKFSDFVLINPAVKLPSNEQVSFVEMKDLVNGKRFCYPSTTRTNGGGAKFENRDTLFARITPCLENGKICQVKGLKSGIGLGSTEFLVFRGKPNVSDTDFVFYLSRWNEVRSHAEINLDGTSGRQRVPKECFNELILNLPENLTEQTAIASVLSSLDEKIDLLHRQNSTLEKMAETLFRQWFVEEAKVEWESYKLKDLVKHVKPGTNYQPKRIETGIPFLNVRNLSNGFLDLSDTTKISMEEYQRIHKNWQPEENDLLISRIGTLGIVAVIQRLDLPVAVHYNMINLKAKTTSYQFLYFLLKSSLFQEKYLSNIRQSVQEYVAIDDTENIEIALPIGLEEFKKQEPYFVELYNKIKSNQSQVRTLTSLRDNLLPKLMSGEVTVEI